MAYSPSINLVPKPLHGQNLRQVLGRYGWDKLRKPAIADANGQCHACAETGIELFGHEVWEYDTSASPATARLTGIHAICRMCHQVDHYMHTALMVREGSYPPEALAQTVAHFCKINGVGRREFEAHLSEELGRWKELSALDWEVDWGPFSQPVESRAAKQRT